MDRICEKCGKGFTIPKQRGRPALKCEACRGVKSTSKPNAAVSALLNDPSILKDPAKLRELAAKLESPSPADCKAAVLGLPPTKQDPSNTIEESKPKPPIEVGTKVRILARVWQGVKRPAVTGKLVEWREDNRGLYAVVVSHGERFLARPVHLKAA